MSVSTDDNEMAAALLKWLPHRFDSLISALDALADSDKSYTFEFVKSRVPQEEQRNQHRVEASRSKAEGTALVTHNSSGTCRDCGNRKRPRQCGHRGREGTTESERWPALPHLRAEYRERRGKAQQEARRANNKSEESKGAEHSCLSAKRLGGKDTRPVRRIRLCRHFAKVRHLHSGCWKKYPHQERSYCRSRNRNGSALSARKSHDKSSPSG